MRTEEVARWILLSSCVSFLGGFQADRVDEIIQSLNDGRISSIESRDLLFRNGLVIGKGCRMPAVSGA
jgi:hypothetical protein